MSRLKQLRRELAQLQAELEDIYTMSEEASCFRYNVDDKNEVIMILRDQEQMLIAQIEYEEEEEVRKNGPYIGVDPAFRSMADFDRMRI